MTGEDFTVELRVYKSAGYSRETVLRMIESLFEGGEQSKSAPVYLYPRESKIMQQSILEVTGVYRDPIPRPVISEELLAQLQYYLEHPERLPKNEYNCDVIE